MSYQLFHLLTLETDRFLSAICILLWLILLFSAPTFLGLKRGKRIFWIGVVGCGVLAILLSFALFFITVPHGLSATYYGNASWQPSEMKLERYFADGKGGRIDRFIDFDPKDFHVEYPFSGRPFSISWEGTVFVPFDNARLAVESNFDTWLSIDEQKAITQVVAPARLDIGIEASREYLSKNKWSYNEQADAAESLTFAWAVSDDANVILGVPEIADYELQFRCMPFSFPGSSPQIVRVFLEKRELGSVTLQNGWQTYSLRVPASLIQTIGAGSLQLMFTFSAMATPACVIAGSHDERELAAAFDWIELRSLTPIASPPSEPLLRTRGFHAIRLQARSLLPNPFIRLLWFDGSARAPRIVPADALFPKLRSPETISTSRTWERMMLLMAISYKIILICWWCGLGVAYLIRPTVRFLWRKETAIILGIGVFAFAIRFIFLLEMRTLDPDFYFPTPGSDHATYVFMARGFFRGYWPNLTHQPFYFSPLIAFYMITVSMLFGEHLTIVRVITALLGSMGVVFAYLVAKRTMNQTVAYLTAAFCACNSVLIFYDISLLSDPLVVVLNLGSIWLMLKWNERLSFRTTSMLGIALGLTALSRGTIAILMPFFFLWTLLTGAGTFRRKIAHIALLCAVTAAVILPVTIRNYFSNERHPFVPTNTAGGIVLWANLNPSSNGMGGYDARALQEARKRMKADGTTFGDEVRRFIIEQPASFLRLEFRKLKLFLRGYEVCDNWPYYIFRDASKILSLPWFNFVIIAPLGVMGMLVAWRRWKVLVVLYGFVLVQLFSSLVFNAASRYRLPVIPAFSIFAAYGLWDIFCRIRQKRWLSAAVLFSLFAVMYVAFNYPDAAKYYERQQGKPMSYLRVLRYWDVFYTW